MGSILLVRRKYGETRVMLEHEDVAIVQSATERHYPCTGIKVIGPEIPRSIRAVGVEYANKTEVSFRGRGMMVIERLVDGEWIKEGPPAMGQHRIEFA